MKKVYVFLAACLIAANLFAQKPGAFTINHLALSVKDVNISAKFYAEVLKLPEITNRTKMDGIRWFGFGDGNELHLLSTIKVPVQINKAVHLGLSSNDFTGVIKRLTQQKIMYSDWEGFPNKINIRADGIRQIFFQDPDGYWIEVNDAK